MNPFVIGLSVFVVAVILYVVHLARLVGPQQADSMRLARGTTLLKATRDDPGAAWDDLGSRTTARGLDLLFEHDDDPEAQATVRVPGAPEGRPKSLVSNNRTVRLTGDFETHHVHTAGYVFRVRLRGTEPVVGRAVRIQMPVLGRGRPFGGRIENDDDDRPAVGGWIEIDSLEILELR